jgi:hypothetical protein
VFERSCSVPHSKAVDDPQEHGVFDTTSPVILLDGPSSPRRREGKKRVVNGLDGSNGSERERIRYIR